jgi:hypothetical protein
MVTVVLRGGLGNQMFQYAIGFAAAHQQGVPLVLDTTYLNDRFPRKQFTFRVYDLDIFDLSPKFTTLSKISTVVPIPGLWLGINFGLIKIKNILGIKEAVNEKKEFVFDASALNAGKNVSLWGYWQSPKYFESVENELRSVFRFKHPLEGEAKDLANQIAATNSVSLHVRRGDYVKFKSVAEMMGGTDLSYYDRASRYIGERVTQSHFFIFSDDIEWCKQNIKLSFPVTYVSSSSSGPKSAYHLQLMSLCKNNIIANSTFSWWGAWLNGNPGKIVVAPKQWHINGSETKDDVIPKNWNTL